MSPARTPPAWCSPANAAGVLRAQVFQRAAFTAAADTLGVLFLAYTGVRWGEMAALCVGRLDLMRRRAESFKSGRRRLYACLDRISPARSPRNTGGCRCVAPSGFEPPLPP